MEHYLAYLFRWLAQWAKVPYDGEWRNACAAHIMAGWALQMTASLLFPWYLTSLPFNYGLFREIQDSKYFREWGNKNVVDIITWSLGCFIGLGILAIGRYI